MTTVNHLINPTGTSYKRALREQQKNTVETTKRLLQKLKQQIKDNNINAADTYDEYLSSLLSVHKASSERIDWASFSLAPHPKLPVKESKKQFEAEYNYQTYEPTFLDYITLQHRKKMGDLLDKIELAKHADDLIYNAILKEFRNEAQDWKKIQAITNGIREGEVAAYQKAIDFFDPFAAISLPGIQVLCETFNDHIIVNLHLNAAKVIPDYVINRTADGRLSNTLLNVSDYNRLLHDYACGCALRSAREIFALLPVNFVSVNIVAELVNSSIAETQRKTILSIKFDQENLRKLDFNTMNCQALLAVFSHESIIF